MVPIFKDILKNEGIKGFWHGVHPNVARCLLVMHVKLDVMIN